MLGRPAPEPSGEPGLLQKEMRPRPATRAALIARNVLCLAICRLRDRGRAFYFDRAPKSTSFSAHLQILRSAVIVNTTVWSCLESRP